MAMCGTREFEDAWHEPSTACGARGCRSGAVSSGVGRRKPCAGTHRVVPQPAPAPRIVVQTGVARRSTTALILRSLARGEGGQLWSIDVPPTLERELASETGAAVPSDSAHRSRWTLVEGSSRANLPGLVRDLGQIDVFLHDGMRTARNMLFELRTVWPYLSPGALRFSTTSS
jgi:Methyltransferase domain